MDTITAKSHFGTVAFDGKTITIERSSMTPQGRSTKRIPLRSVQAIQYASAKFLGPIGAKNGYIAFTLAGGIERQARNSRQTLGAMYDENAVLFRATKRQAAEFEALYQAIIAAQDDAA